jgi:muramoyltetrapeptide carboxypeptidase
MSSIYIYSPSGAVRDKAAFKRGVKRLSALGHQVQVDPSALLGFERFAGEDKERTEAIERAASSGADVAMITRGGYGLSRILPRLPYKKIAKAIKQGTKFVGLSDYTAFQMATFAKTGAVTWAGPAVISDFGADDEPSEITELCFEDLVTGRGEGTGWRVKSALGKELFAQTLRGKKNLALEGSMLWGGNLSMICSLIGTDFFPHIESGILFLEDVAEHPYRVERMLLQLHHAGVLARQKAIILGSFTDFKLTPHDKGYGLKSVFKLLSELVRVPVICDLPFGHTHQKICLPFGEPVTLASEGQDVFLFWNSNHHHADESHHAHQ